ncbi:MAG TPA: hypothetical protein DEO56_11415 [Nitrosomonas nitrosa]|nr:hypothetical protein [Nitrosomonas nitrosa]HNP52675.1 hypothetical protein [Nitrosomonas nitrosa]
MLAPNAKLCNEIILGSKKKITNLKRIDDVPHSLASVRINWVRLLKQLFGIDIKRCPHSGRTLKIIAVILEFDAITQILNHLVLSARTSPIGISDHIFDSSEYI